LNSVPPAPSPAHTPHRLEASGKAVWLREEWEDHQLDMLLQQHCGNTPQAAAMWAAWPCVVDGAGTRAGTPRAKRRSREEAEGDAGGSPATEARRVSGPADCPWPLGHSVCHNGSTVR
jgi:hypothetical protein